MEISTSSVEGEAPRPKDKGRAVAPSSSLMDVDEALPEAAERLQPEDVQRAQQEALDQAQAAGREAGPDLEATPLPPQPASHAARAVRDDRSSAVSTLQPDPNDIGSRKEMMRLRAAPPPWFSANPKRWVVMDIEDYTLWGPHGKGEGDTITYMYNTWPERQSRVFHARRPRDRCPSRRQRQQEEKGDPLSTRDRVGPHERLGRHRHL